MTMNLDELRDAHAKRLGWEWQGGCKWFNSRKTGIDATIYSHPVPDTLDAIAALMPSGWEVFRVWQGQLGEWRAYVRIGEEDQWRKVVAPDTDDELLDRARLAWLAWEAEAKGAK
jgi:diadenosine tetraphosphatase ApaH/serine/threonine PP2A family protein phosphatase